MQRTPANLRTDTRLEEHRRRFELDKGRGPLLRIEELTDDEQKLLNYDFMERCRGQAQDISSMYRIYIETLHAWGVICPHPQRHRLYNGFHQADTPIPFTDSQWFDCDLCGTGVINR